MNYQETLQWMFAKLPMYQRQGNTAFKKDLTNILALSKCLNFPEKKFKSIHVAGTNGKGSSSHMLASVLQEAGFKVGLYTSPHLKDFRERIRINGKEIPEKEVVNFIEKNKNFLESQGLSFFEMTVGMAFDYFAQQQVDIAVIEVGLGGRLDSTNIIEPLISVITNIGLDHTQFLGDTLEEIAFEKGGIIKPNIPVIIGETQAATKSVFEDLALKNNAPIYFAEDKLQTKYTTDLIGSYQAKNLNTVVQTLEILKKYGLKISEKDITLGLNKVVKNTGLKGRWQTLGEQPKIICDTAHNREGLHLVMRQLLLEKFANLHVVMGVVNDKNLENILPLFPKKAKYYFCKPDIPRGLDAIELQKEAHKFKLKGNTFSSVANAFQTAKQEAKSTDLIYAGGSTFVVAELPI